VCENTNALLFLNFVTAYWQAQRKVCSAAYTHI